MHFLGGMNLRSLAPFALAALFVPPRGLPAQDSTKGKIGDAQRSADDAKKKGGGDSGDHDGGGLVLIPEAFINGVATFGRGVYLLFTYVPVMPGQGYQPYPYAQDGSPFVRRDVAVRRTFGAASASYFMDDQSSLRATHVSVQWAGGMLHREIELSAYAEPTSAGTDHLVMFRMTFAAAPRLGDLGFATFGGGVQIVTLGSGDAATGPEL